MILPALMLASESTAPKKFNRILRWVLTVPAFLFTSLVMLNWEIVSQRLGLSTVVADAVVPEKGPSPFIEFVTAPAFSIGALVIVCLAFGAWLDTAVRAWDSRRERQNWWHKVQAFTIRDAACLLANIKRSEFEKSDRAAAIANELRGYVNSGHMPTFLEFEFEKPTPDFSDPKLRFEPPYDKKDVGFDAMISKTTVESIARGRKWSLPWPIPPKGDRDSHRPFPRPQPLPPGNALAALLTQENVLGKLGGIGKKDDDPKPV